MPELIHIHIDLIGEVHQSELRIIFQTERATQYDTYIKIQDKLTAAYLEV